MTSELRLHLAYLADEIAKLAIKVADLRDLVEGVSGGKE